MVLRYGDTLARKTAAALHPPVADTAAITAIAAMDRVDGMLVLETANGTVWQFDDDGAAAAGSTILDVDTGSGQWVSVSGGGSVGVGSINLSAVLYSSAGALAAYTRTGNVILADAVGALGAQDGITGIAGSRFLLIDGAADADNALWRIDEPGDGSTKYQMTRVGDADASAEVTAGMLVYVSKGATHGKEWFFLTAEDPVTLNTTALTFVQIPSLVDLASTAGAGLIGILDTATRIAAATVEAALAELAGRVFAPVADDAALIAMTAAQRVDGMLVVKLDDMTGWSFDAGSSAGASDWVQVPSAGTGRWLRGSAEAGLVLPPVADNAALIALAAINRVDGSMVVQLDTMTLWKYDLGSAAAASDWVVLPTDGTGRWLDAANPSGGLILPTVANNAALIALTAVDRQDGSLLVQLDTNQVWKYFIGSAVGASDWVVVPTDGVGRWHDAGHPDGGLVLPPVADNAALIALTAVDRQDGSLVCQFDTMYVWRYDLGSIAGADDWTVAPTDGVGRWVRTDIAVADAIGVTATTGGELIGLYDPNAIITAVTLGAAAREAAAEMNVHRPGVPMINRLIMLGAPAAIVAGDYFTIGADLYEFRGDTPPTGGTAGRIWLYNGANSAASRATAINAINGVVDAPTIGGPEVATELMLAVAGTTLGTIDVRSADAVGGNIAPSDTATACTDNLTTATDIWDDGTMYGGQAQGPTQIQWTTVAVTAAMITATFLEIEYDFTPVSAWVADRDRPHDDTWTITADRVVLTFGGAGAPNIQAGDVLDIHVQG